MRKTSSLLGLPPAFGINLNTIFVSIHIVAVCDIHQDILMSIPIASVIADFVSLNSERQRLFGSTARVAYNSKLISATHDNEATNALSFFAF
jgi:hypothetical protein